MKLLKSEIKKISQIFKGGEVIILDVVAGEKDRYGYIFATVHVNYDGLDYKIPFAICTLNRRKSYVRF